MRLKAKTLLDIAVLDRGNYDALKARGHLPFLSRDVAPDGGADRFGEVHLLAMVVFQSLRRLGLGAQAAAQAVDDGWSDICAVVAGLEPDNGRCGVGIYPHVIYHDTLAKPPAGQPYGEHIADIAVYLPRAWRHCQQRLAKLEATI